MKSKSRDHNTGNKWLFATEIDDDVQTSPELIFCCSGNGAVKLMD